MYDVSVSSVADPWCLSRFPDPDFYPSRIPDLGSKNSNNRQGWKNVVVIHFFVAANFTKLKIIIFEMLKKKIWASFQRIREFFTQKFVTKLSKIWVWASGSRIRDKGSGIRKKPISRHRIPDPQHFLSLFMEKLWCTETWNSGCTASPTPYFTLHIV